MQLQEVQIPGQQVSIQVNVL